jgi:Xaa-Pro aminopeptidase
MAGRVFFPISEYERRVEAVCADIRDAGLDCVLVTSPENICYLTGFQTPGYHISQSLVLTADRRMGFVIRNTETINIPDLPWTENVVSIPVASLSAPVPLIVDCMKSMRLGQSKVGVDLSSVFFPPANYLGIRDGLPEARFEAAQGIVERHRAVKSDLEVDLIRSSVAIAEQAVLAGASSLAEAETDSDVAAAVAHTLARLGSEYTGSPAYVVAGTDSLLTHSTHARRPIRDQDAVRMEVCASQGRYHGVLTRLAAKGTPTDDQLKYFDISAQAAAAMIDAARPGVAIGDVDRAGRDVVETYVPSEYWPNRGGYSMGISFPPGLGEGDVLDIRPGDTRPMQAGMVFHLLPTLRVPGVGAISCTETFAVTTDGAVSLGTLPREVLTG